LKIEWIPHEKLINCLSIIIATVISVITDASALRAEESAWTVEPIDPLSWPRVA